MLSDLHLDIDGFYEESEYEYYGNDTCHKCLPETKDECDFCSKPILSHFFLETIYLSTMTKLVRKSISIKDDWSNKFSDKNINEKYRNELKEQIKIIEKQLARDYRNWGDCTISADSIINKAFGELAEEIRLDNLINEEPYDCEDIQWNDSCIPESLRSDLENELDKIALKTKDFHPNTNNMIQNLIHPSLFPIISGVTMTYDNKFVIDKFLNVLEEDMRESYLETETLNYQWMPAEFYVDDNYKAQLLSYINNLPGDIDDKLHQTIVNILSNALPEIENLLEIALSKKQIQVIVKACNYILKPGQSYEGNWHVEGCSYEHIVASGIYYYSTDGQLDGDGLSFRRKRNEEHDFPSQSKYREDPDRLPPGGIQKWDQNIILGTAETPQNRLLIFKNSIQHKVAKLTNNTDKIIKRKILCFFFVDPNEQLLSSKDIPQQQLGKNDIIILLDGYILPVLSSIVSEYVGNGISYEDALNHRLRLMKERKFSVDYTNKIYERKFSLCEH